MMSAENGAPLTTLASIGTRKPATPSKLKAKPAAVGAFCAETVTAANDTHATIVEQTTMFFVLMCNSQSGKSRTLRMNSSLNQANGPREAVLTDEDVGLHDTRVGW